MNYDDSLWLFFLLVSGIIAVPGMDMLFVLANGLTGGARAGLTATLGLVAGGAVHTLYGTLGTALLVTFAPALFLPLLIAGAAYMVWIGYTLIRSRIVVETVQGAGRTSTLKIAGRAMLTCLLNPKAYVFVIAVYPQFLRLEYGSFVAQGVVLGLITAGVQFSLYGGVALAASRARKMLLGAPRATIWLGRSVGIFMILAALITAGEGFLHYA
ncbi:LysE family translocator [Rhizobium halophytocola]|uniref:Threonine/homoserine/homoserine lactone efflux protein n=1 Tax=Rhizobium halophytocola TaxID=735519 RepID=A0ABS4DWV3_9HYPH|nr:LysE family translocator [Rhizobium halophytocola]MBP1850176.1 threonine/homoserine/homoserine lactone efflux protein [Rhizobium halophytocola]